MKRVTGIGGIFFQARDPQSLRDWYRRHLGIDVQGWGGAAFPWTDDQGRPVGGSTVWSIGAADAVGAAAGAHAFTINYRVHDLAALLQALRDEGCQVEAKTESSEYGHFGWVIDPEGHRVELWQPPEGQ